MISRVWKATATPDGASRYAGHFRGHVLPALGGIAGYQGAMLLQSAGNGAVDLIVVSFWTSEEAIRQFAGSDVKQAVVADDARRILQSFDDRVRHYSVIAHDRLFHGGRKSDKSTVIDRQAIVEEPSLDC